MRVLFLRSLLSGEFDLAAVSSSVKRATSGRVEGRMETPSLVHGPGALKLFSQDHKGEGTWVMGGGNMQC